MCHARSAMRIAVVGNVLAALSGCLILREPPGPIRPMDVAVLTFLIAAGTFLGSLPAVCRALGVKPMPGMALWALLLSLAPFFTGVFTMGLLCRLFGYTLKE